jgi:hypothetical protein
MRCVRAVILATVGCAAAACSSGGDGGFPSAPGAPALMNATRVWAFSPTNVWVLDGSATVHRYDGAAWSTLTTPSTGGLGCIYALSATQVYLCAGSQVLTYDGANFTASDVTGPTGLSGLTALWASSPTDLWVVGDDAIVARSSGSTWTRAIVGSPFKTSIWGSSATDVYALDTFQLSHYDGSTWTDVNLDGGGGDGQVWGTAANNVWVMPSSDRVSHFDGATWQTLELNLVGELAAVWGPAPNDLWAAGNGGSIAHYDGSSWTEVTHQPIGAPYLRQLLCVHGSSTRDIWIVGHQLGSGGSTGLILHRVGS